LHTLQLQLKMMNGVMPSPRLLQTYGLQDYLVFRDALVAGDVGAFMRALQVRDVCCLVRFESSRRARFREGAGVWGPRLAPARCLPS
jgi:hypothetical protein